jgi:hypothetical protein
MLHLCDMNQRCHGELFLASKGPWDVPKMADLDSSW